MSVTNADLTDSSSLSSVAVVSGALLKYQATIFIVHG